MIEEDPYLPTLSRYIHLNPIRTKNWQEATVKEKIEYLSSYQWSTLPGYLDHKKKRIWLDYSKILKYFGNGNTTHRKYLKYIQEGLGTEINDPFKETKHQIILGTDRFADNIKAGFLTNDKIRELPALRRLKALSIELVIFEICEYFGITEDEMVLRKKASSRIKKITMEMCYKCTNLSQREIGERLGNVDYSTVSQNRKRLRSDMERDKKLAEDFKQIDEKLLKLSNLKI